MDSVFWTVTRTLGFSARDPAVLRCYDESEFMQKDPQEKLLLAIRANFFPKSANSPMWTEMATTPTMMPTLQPRRVSGVTHKQQGLIT